MKRKCLGTVLLLCALVCVMGADTISYNSGNPNPNPGGVKGSIESNGTYTLDPGSTSPGVAFTADSGLKSTWPCTSMGGSWALGTKTLPPDTYDCVATLTFTSGGKLMAVNSAVVTVTVK